MSSFNSFAKKHYVNLETFRKNGTGVRTPVWFVQEDERLYVVTMAQSGKVKRIRHNGRINVAPCTMSGTPTGSWQPAVAREINDNETANHVDALLNKKYGLMRKLFLLSSRERTSHNTVLEIKPEK